MKRRGFLKGILAAGCAPFVVTTAGVLMPARDIWKPSFAWLWLITKNEFGVEERIATDLDKPVFFKEAVRIERVEAHVPGIGLMPVENCERGSWARLGGYEMCNGNFTLIAPRENHLLINAHHRIPNPQHREYDFWSSYKGQKYPVGPWQ